MNKAPFKVGVIGCGNISDHYFIGCKEYPALIEVVQCADLDPARAAAKADEYGIKAGTVEELLANPEISIVINLTIPRAHAEVNMAILNAGKHVYAEKPFGISRAEGEAVIKLAKEKGLLVTCAPDTFLGPGHQTCRKLTDEGAIGEVTGATAFFGSPGVEGRPDVPGFHPNPLFFYDIGGGPMLDMGPYYLTALVNLLGPAKSVAAITRKSSEERLAGEQANFVKIPVKVSTHLTGAVEFQRNGVIATVTASWDVWRSDSKQCIEVYGTKGTLFCPHPNTTGTSVRINTAWGEPVEVPLTHAATPHRGSAVADMAEAILEGRAPRASGELAQHVLDIMQAFDESSNAGRRIELSTTCAQPAPMPTL